MTRVDAYEAENKTLWRTVEEAEIENIRHFVELATKAGKINHDMSHAQALAVVWADVADANKFKTAAQFR